MMRTQSGFATIAAKCIILFCMSSIVSPSMLLAQHTEGVKARHHLTAKEDDEATETTLAIDEGAFLGYAGARWGTCFMDSRWMPTAGFRGMWLFQEKLAFGLDLTNLQGRYHPYKDAARREWTQTVTTWGLAIQMANNPRHEFNYQYGATIGRGITRVYLNNDDLVYKQNATRTFFMISPEISVRWNLTKYTRPFAGASAMIPFAGKGNSELKESRLIAPSIFIGIDVGSFTL